MKDDDILQTWMQHGKLLRQLEELQIMIFKQSVSLLLSKDHGQLVIDNELVASCADDVE